MIEKIQPITPVSYTKDSTAYVNIGMDTKLKKAKQAKDSLRTIDILNIPPAFSNYYDTDSNK